MWNEDHQHKGCEHIFRKVTVKALDTIYFFCCTFYLYIIVESFWPHWSRMKWWWSPMVVWLTQSLSNYSVDTCRRRLDPWHWHWQSLKDLLYFCSFKQDLAHHIGYLTFFRFLFLSQKNINHQQSVKFFNQNNIGLICKFLRWESIV